MGVNGGRPRKVSHYAMLAITPRLTLWVLESRLSRNQRLFGSCVIWDRIGETGLIYILPGFKVFRLPRFFEGELVWTLGGPKRKNRLTIAKEVSWNDGKDSRVDERRTMVTGKFLTTFILIPFNTFQILDWWVVIALYSNDEFPKPNDRVQIERKPTINFQPNDSKSFKHTIII